MIYLGEDYWIDNDEFSFMVAKKTYVKDGKKAGEVRWVNKTWHSTITQLKDRVATLALRFQIEKNAGSMVDMLNNFILQEKEIKRLIPNTK